MNARWKETHTGYRAGNRYVSKLLCEDCGPPERKWSYDSKQRCKVCGETFKPARSDAKTCSPPCRQKAYRQRKALRIGRAATRTSPDTRNASPDKPVTDSRWSLLGTDDGGGQ